MTIFESWQDQLLLRLKENEFDGIFFRNYYGELITHESGFEIIDGKIFVFQETTLKVLGFTVVKFPIWKNSMRELVSDTEKIMFFNNNYQNQVFDSFDVSYIQNNRKSKP